MRALEAKGWSADSPVLMRVAMPDLVPLTHRIDLSFLGDILQRVEGEPIDLRTDAVVTFHTSRSSGRSPLFRPRCRADQPGSQGLHRWLLAGAGKAIGPNRPLGRHHIEVALLLAKYQELDDPETWSCPRPIRQKWSPGSCRLSLSTSSTLKTVSCFGMS